MQNTLSVPRWAFLVGCGLSLLALLALIGAAPPASAAWVGFTPTAQPTVPSEPTIPPPEPTIPPPEPTVPPEPTPLPTPVPAPPYETPRPKPGEPELPEKKPVPPPLPPLPTVAAAEQPPILPITGQRSHIATGQVYARVPGLTPDKLAVRLIVSRLVARGLFDPSLLIFAPAAGLPEPGTSAVSPAPQQLAARPRPPLQPPAALPRPQAASNLVFNGNFEDGFEFGVARGWSTFASPDGVVAGWSDDTWPPVVYEGQHSQLLSLKDAQLMDRYVGIYQTIPVVPAAEYVLSLNGLVRSDQGSVAETNYGHRLQYGIDYQGGTDWRAANIVWIELMWDEQPRTAPPSPAGYRFDSYTTTVKAQTDRLTLFIRAWKKWPGPWEANYNLDAVSLVGAPAAALAQPAAQPAPAAQPGLAPGFLPETSAAGERYIPPDWLPPLGKASVVVVNEANADLVFTMAGQEHKLPAHSQAVFFYEPGTHAFTASDPRFKSYNSACTLRADTVYYWYTDDLVVSQYCAQIWP